MSRLRAVNGHGFTPSPHIDEQPRDYATLVADINERHEARVKRINAMERTVWIIVALCIVLPLVLSFGYVLWVRS